MTRTLATIAFVLILAGCGSDLVDTGDAVGTTASPTSASPTTTSEPPPTTSPTPDSDQLAAVRAARARWDEAAPAGYVFEYFLGCECDGGPFRVEVDESGDATVFHMYDGPTDWAYTSIDAILDEIEQAILEAKVPVRAEYHEELGYPTFYVWNEPELPVEGGFTLEITYFSSGGGNGEHDDLEAARATWRDLVLADYDYTFTRQCFCAEEWRGPYDVQVRGGEVVAATFRGESLLEIDALGITAFSDLVLTVDDLFNEIERSIGEVAELTVEYDAELGYPANVFIDVDERIADEEIEYVITDLRPIPAVGDECSTSAVAIDLIAQPNLPDAVGRTRQAIYDAAMDCDIAGLVELTDPDGFNASFGGGDPATLWADAELRGDPVLLDLVRHLNQAFTEFGDGGDITGYVWPSAFLELEAPDGTGLPAEEWDRLLALYSQAEIREMFDGIGGYVGYRIGIEPDGDWIYFVAGD